VIKLLYYGKFFNFLFEKKEEMKKSEKEEGRRKNV